MHYNIKSRLEEIHKFEVEFENQLNNLNLTKQVIFNIKLAFHEAIINVVQHTYNFEPDRNISIELDVNKEYFECSLEDFGKHVDPEHIKPRKTEKIQSSGLGVFLYSKLMDEVEFSNTDTGNILRLKRVFKPVDFKS